MSQNSESPPTFIAIRELTGIDSTGREFPIKLAIGQPYQVVQIGAARYCWRDFCQFSPVQLALTLSRLSCWRSA
jgi:hypothetical protein